MSPMTRIWYFCKDCCGEERFDTAPHLRKYIATASSGQKQNFAVKPPINVRKAKNFRHLFYKYIQIQLLAEVFDISRLD